MKNESIFGNEPEHIEISYGENIIGSDFDIKFIMLYNATCLFANANQLKSILFNYNSQSTTITRESLNKWYETELTNLTSERNIMEAIQHTFNRSQQLPI